MKKTMTNLTVQFMYYFSLVSTMVESFKTKQDKYIISPLNTNVTTSPVSSQIVTYETNCAIICNSYKICKSFTICKQQKIVDSLYCSLYNRHESEKRDLIRNYACYYYQKVENCCKYFYCHLFNLIILFCMNETFI